MADTEVATVPASTKEIPTTTSRQSEGQQCSADGLSNDQKDLLEKTWKMVEDTIDLQQVGFILFRKIFEIAPNAIELFPKFKDIPPNERENDEDYRHHALQVVEAVQLAVQTLDDLPGLTMVLHDLGSVHSLHGVYDPHFDVVGQALLWTLEQGLGEAFTVEVKEAWTAFYNIVAKEMKAGLAEARAIQGE